jgi:hypothetical protein
MNKENNKKYIQIRKDTLYFYSTENKLIEKIAIKNIQSLSIEPISIEPRIKNEIFIIRITSEYSSFDFKKELYFTYYLPQNHKKALNAIRLLMKKFNKKLEIK